MVYEPPSRSLGEGSEDAAGEELGDFLGGVVVFHSASELGQLGGDFAGDAGGAAGGAGDSPGFGTPYLGG